MAKKASEADSIAAAAKSEAEESLQNTPSSVPEQSSSASQASSASSEVSSAASSATSSASSQATDHKKPNTILTNTTQGRVPSANATVSNLPEGSKVVWIKKPDVSKPGIQKGVIQITYPDGRTERITVEVNVRPKATQVSARPHRSAKRTASRNRYGNSNARRAQWLRDHGYVVIVGPDGEIISYYKAKDGIGRIVEGKKELPQTGASQLDNMAAILGLSLASLGFIFGLADIKKRKKED